MAFDTTPRPDDTDNVLLQKILLQVGGTPRPADLDATLSRKILEQLGGVFRPADTSYILARKILESVGGIFRPADTFNRLLWKIVEAIGNVPRPADYDNILLQKIALPINGGAGSPLLVGFTGTPTLDPGGDPAFTFEVTDPAMNGKWLSFRVALSQPSETPALSDFVLVLVGQAFVGEIFQVIASDHPDWPVPFSPVKVCVEVNIGATEAAAILARGGATTCAIYPDDFAETPDAPVAIAATGVTDTEFDANWNSVADATGYRLDVSTDPAFGSFVPGFNNLDVGNVTTRLVNGLTEATDYYYRVRAYNSAGTSLNSNTITAGTNDSEVDNWADVRVPANGGTVSVSTKTAARNFMRDVKSAGLRSKIIRLNLFAGNQLAAAVVPLVIDAGGATDVVGPGSAAFGADWAYTETGATAGIGRVGIPLVSLSTGTDLSVDLASINDIHQSVYKRGTTLEPTCVMGVVQSGLAAVHCHWPFSDGNSYWDAGNLSTARVSAADAVRQGFYLGVRTSAADIVLYRGGAVLASTAAGSGGALPVGSSFVLASNGFPVGSSQEPVGTAIRLVGYSLGTGMNSTEANDFYNAWQTFQTALSRQV